MSAAAQTDVLKREADGYPEQAAALQVTDAASYQQAAGLLQAIKGLRDKIDQTWRPMQQKAHSAWQEVLAQRKGVEQPLETAERTLKANMSSYDAEQRRI